MFMAEPLSMVLMSSPLRRFGLKCGGARVLNRAKPSSKRDFLLVTVRALRRSADTPPVVGTVFGDTNGQTSAVEVGVEVRATRG